jgi:polyhydroxybutyrate depolymerase
LVSAVVLACVSPNPAVAAPATPTLSSPSRNKASPLPSQGCALAPAERTQKGRALHLSRRLSTAGTTRRFLLVLPEEQPATPMPLVLNFHGLFESPQLQQLLTRMDAATRSRGWALAYPHGVGLSWNAGVCCGRAKDEQRDDVQFVRELVAQLGRELCLDLRRVYATGISNGGFFSYRLACEAGDLIAAAAPVAALDPLACTPRRPVPVLAINGTGDFIVPFGGGLLGMPSAQESFSRWRARNRCAGAERVAFAQGDSTCVLAEGCAADTARCTVDGGGHTWPAGYPAVWLGKTTQELDATGTVLEFFAAQARE